MKTLFRSIIIFFLFFIIESCHNLSTKTNPSKEDSLDAQLKQSVTQLKNQLSHDIVTREIIESESDSTLEDLVFSNIYVNIHASTNEDYKREFHKISTLQQTFYSTLMLERNFNEGQFYCYFDHFHYFSNDASKGYKILGFPELSKIVDQANNLYENTAEKKSSMFSDLDSVFAVQLKSYKTSFARIHLIRSNIDSFITKQ